MQPRLLLFAASAAVLAGAAISADADLPKLCDLANFTFHAYDGHGKGHVLPQFAGGACDAVTMASSDAAGAAASFISPRITVLPGRLVNISFSLATENLAPVAGGLGRGAASLTGSVYIHFYDNDGDSGRWSPQFGTLAPSTSPYAATSVLLDVPTTAATMELHLAFAAHTDSYSPSRMTGGRATGNATIGNLHWEYVGNSSILPPTIHVDDPVMQGAVDQAYQCLHNSQLGGNFTVGAGYTISGNISPDLTFGLLGVRRSGHPEYVQQYIKQWAYHAPDPATGEYTAGRVMGQVNWPLGVDNIFSFTGDVAYLEANLPLVDKSFEFVQQHADELGLSTLVPVGKGHVGGGADWVDWYRTRLDGRSFQFHLWLAKVLLRFASLHSEFSSSFGNATLAQVYTARSAKIMGSLAKQWLADHWLTNPDYKDEGQWYDDTVWSIYYGLATEGQSATLWGNIDKNTSFNEGVPIRWGAFPTGHWYCSWFGRLGAGDILARYRSQQYTKGLSLLSKISQVITEHANIYEGYDMNGCGLHHCGCTTSGYGDYLEHCGGLVWAHMGSVFGIDFDSSPGGDGPAYLATLEPRFPAAWGSASATTFLRGSALSISWAHATGSANGTLSLTVGAQPGLSVDAPSLSVRILGCGLPDPSVITLAAGGTQHFPGCKLQY